MSVGVRPCACVYLIESAPSDTIMTWCKFLKGFWLQGGFGSSFGDVVIPEERGVGGGGEGEREDGQGEPNGLKLLRMQGFWVTLASCSEDSGRVLSYCMQDTRIDAWFVAFFSSFFLSSPLLLYSSFFFLPHFNHANCHDS